MPVGPRRRDRMERELHAVMETGEDGLLIARPEEGRQTAADRAKSGRRGADSVTGARSRPAGRSDDERVPPTCPNVVWCPIKQTTFIATRERGACC